MNRMRLLAAGALAACAVSGAGADPPKHQRTTCEELKQKFEPPARWSWDACHNQHFFDGAFDASMENAENDQPVVVYRARGTARYELLVFFPGGGGTPGPYDGFMTRAADLGYDVVGLGVPSHQNALDGTPAALFDRAKAAQGARALPRRHDLAQPRSLGDLPLQRQVRGLRRR